MLTPINEVLNDLIKATSAEGAIIVSTDGLTIASKLKAGQNENKISAMSASILSLGQELQRGNLQQLYLKGEEGYLLFNSINNKAMLGLIVSNDTRLGMLFLQMKNASEKLEKFM